MLYQADCLSLFAALKNESIDCVFADPPFNLGKIYGNRMVDLRPRSAKLRARALRLVSQLGRVSPREAERLLAASGASAKVAIAMARLRIDAPEARRRLNVAAGSLRRALE